MVNFRISLNLFHWCSTENYINLVNCTQYSHFTSLIKFISCSSSSNSLSIEMTNCTVRMHLQFDPLNGPLIAVVVIQTVESFVTLFTAYLHRKKRECPTCTVRNWLKINQNLECRIPPTDIFTAILPSSWPCYMYNANKRPCILHVSNVLFS